MSAPTLSDLCAQGRTDPAIRLFAHPAFVHDPKADSGEVGYLLAMSYGPPRLSGVFGLVQWVLGSHRP